MDAPSTPNRMEKIVLKFYFNGAPNPLKVALMLEETGLGYDAIALDTKIGDQHTPQYRTINPNGKAPSIVDGEVTVFDSNAILLYLAEKTGQFLPEDTAQNRGALLSWMMFVASGIGPFSGQAVHFRHFAPGENAYAKGRYAFEARRHWQVVEDRLAKNRYMLGDTYTIVDMSVWGWATRIPFMLGDEAMAEYPSLGRLMDEINARPAAVRALGLAARHSFKQAFDDDAMRNLYPHIHASRTS